MTCTYQYIRIRLVVTQKNSRIDDAHEEAKEKHIKVLLFSIQQIIIDKYN